MKMELIKDLIKKDGRTQSEISLAMGKHESFVSVVMTRGNMTVDTLESLLKVLGYELAIVGKKQRLMLSVEERKKEEDKPVTVGIKETVTSDETVGQRIGW